jgi:carbon monoxide dehydrogenase subunit G
MRIELSLEIARPPEDVFALLADAERLPDWQSGTRSARAEPPGPLAAGARVHQEVTFLGRPAAVDVDVVRAEPPKRLTLAIRRGPLPLTADHILEERGGRTLLTFRAETERGGLATIAGPLVRRRAERELRGWFENLKRLAEADRSA